MEAFKTASETPSSPNNADSDGQRIRSSSRQLHKRISPVTELSVIAEDTLERPASGLVLEHFSATASPFSASAVNSSLSAVSYESLFSTATIETRKRLDTFCCFYNPSVRRDCPVGRNKRTGPSVGVFLTRKLHNGTELSSELRLAEQEENEEASIEAEQLAEAQPEPESEEQRREEAAPRNLAEEASAYDDVRKLLHDCTARGDFALLEFTLNNLLRVHRSIFNRRGEKTRAPNPTVSEMLNSKHYGDTLLTTAIKNDHEAIAKWLVLRGAKTNVLCPTYDYYEEVTKKRVQISPAKKPTAKKKVSSLKPKQQIVKSTKECVDYYEIDVRQLAYIHEMYDFVEFLDKFREKYGD